ncbi:MAG: nicotinamide-nucleotide amidohydrolase family protein [Chitinophagaceae bacterium]|nr:nicotinamide-nucleotide amidohydrolase family protein [Chitinophagaceae bacterium]
MATTPFDLTLINKLRTLLIDRNESVAVAESVTAGLIQAALSQADDAIQFFQGGITTYNLGQKARHLFVEPTEAAKNNCVSLKVATAMAVNVCPMFTSDWGIAITGYASTVPESGNKLFAYYAVAYKGKIVIANKAVPPKGKQFAVQVHLANEVIQSVHDYLIENPG